MRGFVVVSGLPASGKTTIAIALAAQLRLPLFDKDAFLEALFESEGTGGLAWRRQLSQRADAQLRAAASSESAAILASWWKHPRSNADSGTPTEWLVVPSRSPIEVHCTCRVSVAAARFLARQRHPGHLDGRWSQVSILPMFEQQRDLGPLFPRSAIVINTEQCNEVTGLAQWVKAKLHEANAA